MSKISPMTLYRQRGASMYSILIIGALVIYFAVTAIKLGPVYLDDYKIKSALEKAAHEFESGAVSKSEIRTSVGKGLEINDINTIQPKQIELEESSTGVMIALDYEVRVPMFYNIDAMLKFSHRVPLSKSN